MHTISKLKFSFEASKTRLNLASTPFYTKRLLRLPYKNLSTRQENNFKAYPIIKLGEVEIHFDKDSIHLSWDHPKQNSSAIPAWLFKIKCLENYCTKNTKDYDLGTLHVKVGDAPLKKKTKLTITLHSTILKDPEFWAHHFINSYLRHNFGNNSPMTNFFFAQFQALSSLFDLGSNYLENHLQQQQLSLTGKKLRALHLQAIHERKASTLQVSQAIGFTQLLNKSAAVTNNLNSVTCDLLRCESTVAISKEHSLLTRAPYFEAELVKFKLLSYKRNNIFDPVHFCLNNFYNRLLCFIRNYTKSIGVAFMLSVVFAIIFASLPASGALLASWGAVCFTLTATAPSLLTLGICLIGTALFAQQSLATNPNRQGNVGNIFSSHRITPVNIARRTAEKKIQLSEFKTSASLSAETDEVATNNEKRFFT